MPCSLLITRNDAFKYLSSRRSERMSGPLRTTSPILASLSRENFCRSYRNAVPLRSIAFTKFFMRPYMTRRGGNKILDDSTCEWCVTFLCPGSKIFLTGHILLTQWCALSLMSHSHRKQGNLVYPICTPRKSAMTMFHLYVSYFMYCSNYFVLSSRSLLPNACVTGMESRTFPMCRRIALEMTLEESVNSFHSSQQWLIILTWCNNGLNTLPVCQVFKICTTDVICL